MGVTVVCGAPGSGKSTWVSRRAQPGDLIVDLDTLYVALSGLPMYEKPQALLPFVCAARDAVYRRLCFASGIRDAWLITADPKTATRANLHRTFGARVIVLAVSAQTCLDHIRKDERRSENIQFWEALISQWYRTYRVAGFDVAALPAEEGAWEE